MEGVATEHRKVDGPCRRRVGRAPLSLPCGVILADGSFPCLLENISLDGAGLKLDHQVEVGRTLWLRLQAYEVFATTRWAAKNRYGVEFDDRLPKVILLQMQGHSVNLQQYEEALSKRAAKNWVMGDQSRPPKSPLIKLLDVMGPKTRDDFASCIKCDAGEPCAIHCGHKQFRRHRSAYRARASMYLALSALGGLVLGVASMYLQ